MYSIGSIIYGSPMGDKARKAYPTDCGGDDWEEMGFVIDYHGGLEYPPAYIGEYLSGISDATDAIRLDCDKQEVDSSYNGVDKPVMESIKPTQEQMDKAKKAFDALPEDLKKCMPPLGTYIVWSTS
tara:strand:- start:1735 stop:2112 length:378 start_codon:yes stop_codon:yes gene_type:complete